MDTRRLTYESSYQDTDKSELSRLYYGSLVEDTKGDLIEIPYSVYSDYSGCVVERANCDYVLANYDKLLSIAIWEVYGGYGTRGIVRLVDFHSDDENIQYLWDSLLDEINGLDNYPAFDDEYISQLELEMESEEWDSYIKSDLSHQLIKSGIYDDDSIPDDDTLRSMMYSVMEKCNIYWEAESAVSGYIDIDQIVTNWNN